MPKPPPPVTVILYLEYNNDTGELTISHVGGDTITDAIINGSFENLVVIVTGCSPTIESITGYENFSLGDKIIVKYTGDIPASGDIISVVYKPRSQLLKTMEI